MASTLSWCDVLHGLPLGSVQPPVGLMLICILGTYMAEQHESLMACKQGLGLGGGRQELRLMQGPVKCGRDCSMALTHAP